MIRALLWTITAPLWVPVAIFVGLAFDEEQLKQMGFKI